MQSQPEEPPLNVQNEEFNFLIAKYLKSGPFKDVGDILTNALEEKKALPKRLDWTGREHDLGFDELNETYGHVPPDYLRKVAQCAGRTHFLDDGNRANNVEGTISILRGAGCGRLDPVRNAEESRKARWNIRELLYSRNPWLPRSVPTVVASSVAFPSWPHLYVARLIHGFLHPEVQYNKHYYKDFQLHRRILGHLAAVFNVIFDRSGKFIITGSDDRLLKLWSALDGRLLFTFRGHVSEIVFMSINDENTMLASVGNDRMIRVWNMVNGAQIVVHRHPGGMVSNLKFSPSVRGNHRFLVASSMDGTVTCWKYDSRTLEFLPGEVTINEKNTEFPDTKICSITFSSGGTFMASGSVDAYVRVYNLMADGGPIRICQKALHTDRVDSIEYCHVGDRILTGSKDGTGRIWSYNTKNEWTTIILNSAHSLAIPGSERHDPKAYKRKVTMVGWSLNDQYCILASDDNVMRVFDSYDGHLVFELKDHTDTVYVLENHPFDTNIYLTAGHDARLVLWSLVDGTKLCCFQQWINGHGPSPFVDAKWSPDGTQIAAVDMFGMLNIYGAGKGLSFNKTPEEQFFHTDYRPLMKDSIGFVVDEQTQLAPNMMQPPVLVNASGVAYPDDVQRLVPGRGDSSNEALQQVVDVQLAALDAALPQLNNQALMPGAVQAVGVPHAPIGVQYNHPSDPYKRTYVPQPFSPMLSASLQQRRQDLALFEIEKWREHSKLTGKEPHSRRPDLEATFISPPRHLLMTSISVNGEPSSGVVTANDGQPSSTAPFGPYMGLDNADDSSDADYDAPAPRGADSEDESELSDFDGSIASVEARQGREGIALVGTRRSTRKRKTREDSPDHDFTDEDAQADEDLQLDLNGSVNRDAPSTLHEARAPRPNLRSAQPARAPPTGGKQNGHRTSGKKPQSRRLPSKTVRKQERGLKEKLPVVDVPEGVNTIPPKWLSEVLPRRTPYFPQLQDVLYYFTPAHKVYNIIANREGSGADKAVKSNRPWDIRTLDLNAVEVVKVTKVAFVIKPKTYYRVAELTVERLASEHLPLENRKKEFKIVLQEIQDTDDFLILKQYVDQSRDREPLAVGQRVRAMFYEDPNWAWYKGEIKCIENSDPNFAGSDYHSIGISWDNERNSGEEERIERLSPWDVFLLDGNNEPEDGANLTQEEVLEMAYKPQPGDWESYSLESLRLRVLPLLRQIQDHGLAEYFKAPVDYEAFPDYSHYVPYPVDLHTIIERLSNGFYRHSAALKFDIDQIPRNAAVYNGEDHLVTKRATIVTDVCLQALRDETLMSNVRSVFSTTIKQVELQWKEHAARVAIAGPSRQNGHGKKGRRQVDPEQPDLAVSESGSEPEEENGSEFAPSDGETDDDNIRETQDFSAEEESGISDAELPPDDDDVEYDPVDTHRLRSADSRRNSALKAMNGKRPRRTIRSKEKESPETTISSKRRKARQAEGRHRKRTARQRRGGRRANVGSASKRHVTGASQSMEPVAVSMHGRVRPIQSYAEMEGSDGDVNTPSPTDTSDTVGSSSNDIMQKSRSGRTIKKRRMD